MLIGLVSVPGAKDLTIQISNFEFFKVYQIQNPQYVVPLNGSYMLALCHWVFVLDNWRCFRESYL